MKTQKSASRNIDIDYLLNRDHFKLEWFETDKLVKYAFENRPDLKSLKSKKIMNSTDLEMAKLSRMPDFNVKLRI